jgi:hypothetical protein
MQKNPFGQIPPAARFLGGVFGLIFFAVGLTVIGFMWLSDDGFGSPPLFFKIFATFIALGFVAMGGTLATSAFLGGGPLGGHAELFGEAMRQAQQPNTLTSSTTTKLPATAGYACPHCGGALGANADVSPMGDAKCAFCGRWFNVYGRS